MALLVQKYGGTSMGSVERIDHVASKVAAACERGHQIVVVVSAMSGETDRLTKLAKSISPRPNPR
ncbi:MAG: aspartate kinase, partial [Nevskia sp.]|nr:aspartate kinase [Nevskia sp.]